MAKIRGFKPDLWTDEDFVEVSPFARLLWLGMWNYACDNGHVQDKSKQIKMRVLPTDDVNCAELLRELESQGLIERAHGWITVPNLTHHQKIDRRFFTTCAKSGCTVPEANPAPKTRRAHDESTTCARRDHAWTRGDGDGDGDISLAQSACADDATAEKAPQADDRFDEFWSTYDKKRDRKRSRQKWRLALKKPGVDADHLIAAAATYVARQRSIGKHPEFTKDPATWLNGECWENEAEEPVRPGLSVLPPLPPRSPFGGGA